MKLAGQHPGSMGINGMISGYGQGQPQVGNTSQDDAISTQKQQQV